MKKYKSKWRAEDKVSGIAPNHNEIDEALLELIERFDEVDTARQKVTTEKNPKLKRSLCRHKAFEMPHLNNLARPGK